MSPLPLYIRACWHAPAFARRVLLCRARVRGDRASVPVLRARHVLLCGRAAAVPPLLLGARRLRRRGGLRLPRGLLPRRRPLPRVRGGLLLSRGAGAGAHAVPRARAVGERLDGPGHVRVRQRLLRELPDAAVYVLRLRGWFDQKPGGQRRVRAVSRGRVQRLDRGVCGVPRAHAVGGGLRARRGLRLGARVVPAGLPTAALF